MAEAEKPDIIPGTDIIFTDGNNGENSTPGEVVLIPQPTSNPDDPLVSSPRPNFKYQCETPLTPTTELEHDMEVHHNLQPVHLRLREHHDTDGNLTLVTHLRARIPQDTSGSQYAIRCRGYHFGLCQLPHRTRRKPVG